MISWLISYAVGAGRHAQALLALFTESPEQALGAQAGRALTSVTIVLVKVEQNAWLSPSLLGTEDERNALRQLSALQTGASFFGQLLLVIFTTNAPRSIVLMKRGIVIFRVDINESHLANSRPGRIWWDRRNIQNAETRAVIGLKRKTIDNILVVIDSLHTWLVDAGLFRGFERTNVPDISHGVPISSWLITARFVEFIIQEEVFLVIGIQDPALMGITSSLIRSARDDGGIVLVGYIVYCKRVFVVTIAYVFAVVLSVRTAVY
jgi:hypothetical protein